ncbi:hypothetical protein CFN78_11170 [Amycolatopsis antarctica]|uniref:Transcription regulator PadR N-terminal domain-containing protein n=1 Tax=Amycolatopsis antarctica TaxID=1854586 RepID=A0A263D4U5_9PSEU|nr:PadR family transcriptional regulator [Amycolatopsis antarctica]OZM73391.1 hypothetical protein CFN78_11170 [Amycolatopsis antarctica]
MAGERARRTPLALAVLSLLNEGPRHPYEMRTLIRRRQVGDVVRMRGGSLYDAIARLDRLGLVEVAGTSRSGARPQRTVYAITAAGRAELHSLLREYLGTRAEEYPVFTAGLAHIGHLSHGEASELLHARSEALAEQVTRVDGDLVRVAAAGIPRAVVLEAEYAQTIRRAELTWLRGLIRDIDDGGLGWADLHDTEDSATPAP